MKISAYSEQWYQTLSGKDSLQNIDSLCDEAMSEIFGYYALQMGFLSPQHDLLSHSRIAAGFSLIENNAFGLGNSVIFDKNDIDINPQNINHNLIISTNEQLPVETDNIDLVIATHALELSKDPHQVLREIDRVLVPEGHCILIGFNPFSLQRAGRLFKPEFYKKENNNQKMRSAHRVRDWFSVLGFEVLDVHHFGFRPGVKNKKLFDRLNWLEKLGNTAWPILGNMYMLHVKKQVVAMRPHKKVWKAPAVLTGGKVALNNTAQKIRRQNFFNL
ncbi:MAG TPA: class I SAM-dependent methyltransferase [Leucothrix mucor]|nr:class I SAM-dependent methyltransferase [Leucothrix mucor]